MMTSIISLLLLLPVSPARPLDAGASADTLHCQVLATATGKRRCSVKIPTGRSIQTCATADAAAGHCDKKGNGQYVGWVVTSGGASCKISKKRTDWAQKVTLSMGDKVPVGPSACELYVVLR